MIFADQRDLYLDALEAADSGSSERFVSFIADRTIDTIEMVRSSLGIALNRSLGAVAEVALDLRTRMMILDRAHKLAGVYRALLADVWSELDASAQLALTPGVTGGMGLPAGYDPLDVGAIGYVVTEQNVGRPHTPYSEVHRRVELGDAKDPRADPEFFLSAGQVERGLGVFRRDLSPVVTQVLRIKLRNWITGLVAEDLRLLSARLQEHDA